MKEIRKYNQGLSYIFGPVLLAVMILSMFTGSINNFNTSFNTTQNNKAQDEVLQDKLFSPEKIVFEEYTVPAKFFKVPMFYSLFVGTFLFKSITCNFSKVLSENYYIFFRNSYYTYTFINAP